MARRDPEQVYCRRRFWITPAAQREKQMLTAIAFFFRPPLSRAVHRNALFSSTYLAKFFLTTFKRNNPARALRIAWLSGFLTLIQSREEPDR